MGTGERITEAQAKMLPDAIRACEHHMRPAGVEFLAVQLDRLFEFAAAFGINADRAKAAKFYAPLADLPRDLLTKAIDRAVITKSDSYRLPMPAEIAATVRDDMDHRRAVLGGLRKMERAPVETRAKRTPEELAQVAAAVAKAKAALAEGTATIQGRDTHQRPANGEIQKGAA